MIIELFGLPGSGKSRFATEVAEPQGWPRVQLGSKSEIFKYFFMGFILHPVNLTWGFFIWLNFSGNLSMFWHGYIVRYAKLQKAKLMKYPKVILDEGPTQNLLSYPTGVLAPEKFVKALTSSMDSDTLIFFDLSEVRRKVFLQKRGHTSWRAKNGDDWDLVMQQNIALSRQELSRIEKVLVVNDQTEDTEIVTKINSL